MNLVHFFSEHFESKPNITAIHLILKNKYHPNNYKRLFATYKNITNKKGNDPGLYTNVYIPGSFFESFNKNIL